MVRKQIAGFMALILVLCMAAPAIEVHAAENDGYKIGFNALETAYKPVNVAPKAKSYTVKSDLSNIANLSKFPDLTAEQKKKIAQNGFVVTPSDREQLFYIYEDNDYKKLSGFVSTDSVLQVYHVFFDYALRTSEAEEFFPKLRDLNGKMLSTLNSDYKKATNAKVKAEIIKAIAYFGVASKTLGDALPKDTPSEAVTLINKELELIKNKERTISAIAGVKVDYSQFTPRGHYTRSDKLSKYFTAMMWYGLVPFRLYDENKRKDESSTLCGIVITNALFRAGDGTGPELWESIYSPTCFFVGNSDDINPYQYKEIMDDVYGKNVQINSLAEQSKLDAFYKAADKLPKPLINAKYSESEDTASGLQFRFMGQRYIPDSEILQELTEPLVRPVPSGLDVFAVLGSSRAAELLKKYDTTISKWDGYADSFKKMNTKFAQLPEDTWRSNLYYGWLWTLKSLTGEYGEGYPSFMRNTAWQDKSLATALGSWAELRHDTVLYGKQSGAEKGGPEPPNLPSYVEPNAEVYNKLLWLTRYTRENLSSREILNSKIENRMEAFEDLLEFLLECSIKELKGEALSEADNNRILNYGGTLEYLTSSLVEDGLTYWYEVESDTDKNMAVIADVHTIFANSLYPTAGYLEAGVGTAAEIYVAVPVGDKIYLTRGAVFDYYEFESEKRLTDEEWQKMLKDKKAPERPEWVGSFMTK